MRIVHQSVQFHSTVCCFYFLPYYFEFHTSLIYSTDPYNMWYRGVARGFLSLLETPSLKVLLGKKSITKINLEHWVQVITLLKYLRNIQIITVVA